MSHMEKMSGIPANKVEMVVAVAKASGAKSVTSFKDVDGTFTVVAVYDDAPLSPAAKAAVDAGGTAKAGAVGASTVGAAVAKNTTVKVSTKFADIGDEYVELFKRMQVLPGRKSLVDQQVDRIAVGKPTYKKFVDGLGSQIPWYAVALIHSMESASDVGVFKTHLHNGDPLEERTVHYPAGHPPPTVGNPPFKWEVSAKDALEVEGFLGETDWSLPRLLFLMEKYNGFGYRTQHQMATPYLWSFSDLYAMGKYVADNSWSDSAVSGQVGAATLLRVGIDRGLIESPTS